MADIIILNGIYGPSAAVSGTVAARQFNRTIRGIGPYVLKSWAKSFGHTLKVIDFCHILTTEEILSLLEKFIKQNTIAVGISTTFMIKHVPPHIVAVLAAVKKNYPGIETIAGGAESEIALGVVDRVFYGDAEDQIVDYLDSKKNKSHKKLFNKKFNIVHQQHRFDHDDAILDGEVLPIELGRGCVFKCKFCGYDKIGKPKHTYQREFNLILAELAYNYQNFNTTKYSFIDSTVNEDYDKVKNLSTIKKELGFDIEWTGFLRADLIWANQDSALWLKESGLRSTLFGIESFHKKATDSIGKGWSARHAKSYLPKLKELWGDEITIQTAMIIGLPGENRQSIIDSAQWLHQANLGLATFQALHLKYGKSESEFIKHPEKYGYKITDDQGSWESEFFTYQSAQDLATHVNENILKNNKPATWTLFATANLFPEKTITELSKMNLIESLKLRNSKLDEFKNKYIKKLLSTV